MKKLFTVLFVVLITDIFIFTACIKQCSSIKELTDTCAITEENVIDTCVTTEIILNKSNRTIEYNNDLEKRGKELEKLFKKTDFPIKRKVRYADLIDNVGFENITATCLYFKEGDYNLILHNPKYEIPDNLIIHELCHAALSCADIESYNHSGKEWDSLCDYFEKCGYDPFRDGYSYGVKANY